MAKKKEVEPLIRQFSDKSQNWFYNFKHYSLIEGELKLVAGGEEDKKETELLRKHLKI